MELDRTQPSGNGLREALAPWFDHSAAWLVLLCIALTIFATVTGITIGGHDEELVVLFTGAAVSLAAISLAWRASELPELRPERRGAWRWLAMALLAQLVAAFAVPVLRPFEAPAVRAIADLLQFAFFPCAALAVTGLLRSTRGKAFGPQFWLEATLVALCVGAVLWLALPHDLPDHALPVRGAWTVGLDAVIGVFAAILLLRRSNWQGWPGLATFALALCALVGSHLLEAHAAAAGTLSLYAGPLQIARSQDLPSPRISTTCEASGAHRRWTPRNAVRRSPRSCRMPPSCSRATRCWCSTKAASASRPG